MNSHASARNLFHHLYFCLKASQIAAGVSLACTWYSQGLELSIDRLKSLFKFAFGLGTLQVLLCTAAFTAVPYFGGSQVLELLFNADP